MYSFEPSDEQKMLVETIQRYATGGLRKNGHEADEAWEFPEPVIEKGWELGVLQASVPENYGGFGERSVVTGALAAEEMAWGDLAGTLAVMTPGLFALPLLLGGSEEQKEQRLPELLEAEWKPYTAALLEMKYDFDPEDLDTAVTEEGDCYVITGEKAYVPFADRAREMIVYGNLGGKTQGFIVSKNAEGVEVGERQKMLGLQALPTYRVKFNGVRILKSERLGGPEGHDFAPILAAARVAAASLGVGLAKAAFEYARDYAKDREVFGVKVAQKQAIAFMLAEMATEIEAIRLLTWEAAWMLDNQQEQAYKHAYLALTGATDMAMMVTDRAVQILGGHGYIREHPVEMWMRNGRGVPLLQGLAVI